MSQLTFFIGSSLDGKLQAKALIKAFKSESLTFLPWWKIFAPGSHLADNLDVIKNKIDGAILVFSPEEITRYEDSKLVTPMMRNLLSYYYLYGHLGKGKVAIIKYGDCWIPLDLVGYVSIPGSNNFERNSVTVVEDKTKLSFHKWAQELQTKKTSRRAKVKEGLASGL